MPQTPLIRHVRKKMLLVSHQTVAKNLKKIRGTPTRNGTVDLRQTSFGVTGMLRRPGLFTV